MAFPTSPTDEQIFEDYKYDTNIGAWLTVEDLTVYAKYKNNSSSLTGNSGTIINFNVKISDSLNTVTTGSDWRFVAPYDGVYIINGYAETTIENTTPAGFSEIYFKYLKNGTLATDHIGGKYNYPQTTYSSCGVGGAFGTTIKLLKNEYISFIIIYTSTYGIISSTNPWSSISYISIVRASS